MQRMKTTTITKPSKEFFKALDALSLDFDKLQSKVDRIFEIGRIEGLDDMRIGNYVRAVMGEHYSEKTIRNVLPATAKYIQFANKAVKSTASYVAEGDYNKIICGDALSVLKTFDANSIDCCVTSPPYYTLRDYEVDGQLGWEKTYTEYVDKLVEVFESRK